jgi:hypothetical protein
LPSAPQISPSLSPTGENFLTAVQNAITGLSHRNSVSLFTAASSVPTPSPDCAVVCIQKTGQGLYRSHSQNPNARGYIHAHGDLQAFLPLFQIQPGHKFMLNMPNNLDGTGNILSYIGLIILKDGDGTIDGDVVCYARYFEPVQNVSSVALAPTPTTVAAPAPVTPPTAPVSVAASTPLATPITTPVTTNAVTTNPVTAASPTTATTSAPVPAPTVPVSVAAPVTATTPAPATSSAPAPQ